MTRWVAVTGLGCALAGWSASMLAWLASGDARWAGAALGLWLGAAVLTLVLLLGGRRWMERDELAGGLDVIDTRIGHMGATELAVAFGLLDAELADPTNMRARLDASRARRRDAVRPCAPERRAWTALVRQLDDGARHG